MIVADPDVPKLKFKPMKYGGSLDHLEYVEVTPIIGREYTKVKIRDILHADNAEEQLRDLAVIISERGVVFFRENQDDLAVNDLKKFTDLVGKLSGRPKENGLHVHPLYQDPGNIPMGNGQTDENMWVHCFRSKKLADGLDLRYVINSEASKALYKTMAGKDVKEPKDLGREWHSDGP
jgi:hypothetical protein